MPASTPSGTLLSTMRMRWSTEIAEQLLDLGPYGCETAATWLQQVRSSTGAVQDVLLIALLSASRDGEVAAVEVLLQALVPAVRRATAGLPSLDEFTPTDRAGAAVSAAWESIRCSRTDRDTHVFITLLRDARRILAPAPTANQRHIGDMTRSVDPDTLVDLAGAQPERTLAAEPRLAALLAWAVELRVVTLNETELLRRAYLSSEPVADIARELGTTVDGVRKRAERIRIRIGTAVRDAG